VRRIEPLRREDPPEHEQTFMAVEETLGILPNSTLTAARWPELMEAFAKLNAVVMGTGRVSPVLKQMVAAMVVRGRMHPHQAHTSQVAEHRGADQEKLAALCEFGASSLFSEAERAALRVAHRAGCVPNAVTDEDMADLRRHVPGEDVVELVAVMANFGFLNRWNDTITTELERSLLRRMALARVSRSYLLGMRCTNEGGATAHQPGFRSRGHHGAFAGRQRATFMAICGHFLVPADHPRRTRARRSRCGDLQAAARRPPRAVYRVCRYVRPRCSVELGSQSYRTQACARARWEGV
jgi:alkylhydroperoxidase family enzyme